MRTWLSVGPSALAALLIFAAVHGNLLQALYAFILGALLVWAYERFAKLTAPIILHVSANLISILVQPVSYTHLDVYKRQKEEGVSVVLVNSNPATIMTDKRIADHVYIEPLTAEVLEPVSYTHLDVYKRQCLCRSGYKGI